MTQPPSQPPVNVAPPSQQYAPMSPPPGYAQPPFTTTPRPKKSRKQFWLGVCAGLAAGVLLSVLAVGIGAAVSAVSASAAIANAVDECKAKGKAGISLGDKGSSLTIDTKGEKDSTGADFSDAACILKGLHIPDSVVSQMDATTAMQGRQSAAWENIEASWSYHPNSGMNLILKIAQN